MDEAMNPLTLMTVGLYGKTLPNIHQTWHEWSRRRTERHDDRAVRYARPCISRLYSGGQYDIYAVAFRRRRRRAQHCTVQQDMYTPEAARIIQQGAYTPLDEEAVVCIRWAGALCWVILGLIGFSFLLATVPVNGVSDVPAYARSMMYLSLLHNNTCSFIIN